MTLPAFATDSTSADPYVSRLRVDLHPLLRDRLEMLEARWNRRYSFRRLFVTCTYRNVAAQIVLWRQGRVTPGRKVTDCDGLVTKSQHNFYPSRAVDVAVKLFSGEPDIIKPVVTWNEVLYRPLAEFAGEVGLVSGGTWRKPDWPHLELPREVK